MKKNNKMELLSEWGLWKISKTDLPIMIYGSGTASYNEEFDTRNKFVMLIDCYSLPPVFKIQSLCGDKVIDRCFPLCYRLATAIEVERITNEKCNI